MKKLLALTALFLIGCTSAVEEPVTFDPPPSDPSSNIIDFSTIEIGDEVGAMTVSEIEIYWDDAEVELLPWNSSIDFVGEVTFSANYEHTSDENPFFGNLVCLSEIEHGNTLPMVEDDYRSSRLCFTNQELAHKLLDSEPGDTGVAEFTINSYTWIGIEGEVVNAATLVDVVL